MVQRGRTRGWLLTINAATDSSDGGGGDSRGWEVDEALNLADPDPCKHHIILTTLLGVVDITVRQKGFFTLGVKTKLPVELMKINARRIARR